MAAQSADKGLRGVWWGEKRFQLERSNRSDNVEPHQESFSNLTEVAWLAFGFAVNLHHFVVVGLCPRRQRASRPL